MEVSCRPNVDCSFHFVSIYWLVTVPLHTQPIVLTSLSQTLTAHTIDVVNREYCAPPPRERGVVFERPLKCVGDTMYTQRKMTIAIMKDPGSFIW